MNIDEIPVGQAEDLRGKKYNKLTVLYRVKNTSLAKHAHWKCKCECGNETIVTATNLKTGHVKSCGCIKHNTPNNFIDITGKKFGKLLVLTREPTTGQEAMWKCQCDCGNIVNVRGSRLRSGETQSCGCLAKKRASEIHSIDLTNQRFGKLVALNKTGIVNNKGIIMWHCKCDCGKEIDVSGEYLRNGTTQSCGCLTISHGELAIENLLKQYTIQYTTEKTFPSCIFPMTKNFARFDFYIDNKYLIEYDGIQHFKPTGGWITEDYVFQNQQRDKFKNQWCKNNNIPLIRIPYTHLKDLCIEDLLLETSQFRVT